MRIYKSLKEARKEIERDLWEMGTRVSGYSMQDKVVKDDPAFETMEVTGYGYKITEFWDLEQFVVDQNLSADYLETEFEDRTSSEMMNPGNSWKFRSQVWRPFLHEGRFAYTYAERLSRLNQLERVVEELRDHPSSRQAITLIYDVNDISGMGGKFRIPCSMFYQLMIRNGALDLHYVERSCDFITHFNYDLVLAIKMLGWVANRTHNPPGIFHHYITSLHAYRKDFPPGVF